MNDHQVFNQNSDIWIVLNDPKSFWWNEINFRMAFQLSKLNFKNKNAPHVHQPLQIKNLLTETNLPSFDFKNEDPFTFIGCKNNFRANWVCLVNSESDLANPKLISQIKGLKCQKVTVFAPLKNSSGLKSSFEQIEIIPDSL